LRITRVVEAVVLSFVLLLSADHYALTAQTPSVDAPATLTMDQRAGKFGDQGDGTYINPILPGDFQNTDVLRVGNRYYYIAATKAMSPGMAVMTSDDLVNWKMIGHVIPDITVFGPRFNYDAMDGPERGVWAGTLAYHAGLFYVYFTTPDEGIFVSTAKDPAGAWSPVVCLLKSAGWDDPAPLFDDDGKAYLATTNFAVDPKNGKSYNIHLYEMSADGLKLKLETDRILYQSHGSEANKLYKINGLYYHLFSEVTKEGRVPMIGRAKNIGGPYELHQLNHVNATADREPNQGSLLQTPDGKWVFITHHGLNEWEGRPASLLPVTWIDGWPVAGQIGADGIGNMIWNGTKPVKGRSPVVTEFVDDFARSTLAPEWEWYFQPKPGAWSLSERSGSLRLHALRPLAPGNLLRTPDVLTLRPLRANRSEAVVKMDITHMVDGQRVGLCFLGRTYGAIGLVYGPSGRTFFVSNSGQAKLGPSIADYAKTVWFRVSWDVNGVAQFQYSTDGRNFTPFGNTYQITSFGGFLGAKLGIFTNNDERDAGYVDVDSFRYTYSH
jgi:beta-xylosidase